VASLTVGREEQEREEVRPLTKGKRTTDLRKGSTKLADGSGGLGPAGGMRETMERLGKGRADGEAVETLATKKEEGKDAVKACLLDDLRKCRGVQRQEKGKKGMGKNFFVRGKKTYKPLLHRVEPFCFSWGQERSLERKRPVSAAQKKWGFRGGKVFFEPSTCGEIRLERKIGGGLSLLRRVVHRCSRRGNGNIGLSVTKRG